MMLTAMLVIRSLALVSALVVASAPARGASCEEPLSTIYAKVAPAVVSIQATKINKARPDRRFETIVGSGFLIEGDGHALTNAHVVDGAASIVATLDTGEKVPTRVLAIDPALDLALLKMHLPTPQEVVEDGSPAERAGLRGGHLSISVQGEDYLLGGDIVTAVNGSPVRTREDFGARVKLLKVGQRARLTIFRDGTARDVTLNVAERPRLPYDLSDQE